MTDIIPTKIGEKVPEFELDTYEPTKKDFGTFSLAEAKKNGKWTILMFYPADFTFVCSTEFKALGEQYETLKEAGYEVVSVSTDTKFTHLAWHRHEGELADVKFPMGADHTGKLARQLGVYIEETGECWRGTFIIDNEGKLVGCEINQDNIGRNMEELTRKATAFMHFSKLPDEVCPATWKKPGDKSLKPGAQLVGKVHEAIKG